MKKYKYLLVAALLASNAKFASAKMLTSCITLKSTHRLTRLVLSAVLMLTGSVSQGAVTTFFEEAAWLSSAPVSGSTLVVDSFEDLAGSANSASFARNGFTASRIDGALLEPAGNAAGTAPVDGSTLMYVPQLGPAQGSMFELTFALPRTAISLFLADINDGQNSVTQVFADGVLVVDISGSTGAGNTGNILDSVSGSSVFVGQTNTFMGFNDPTGISSLSVSISSSATENVGYDLVRFGVPVPVPAPFILLGSAMLGIGLSRGRPVGRNRAPG